jgi:hypothetical protein
MKARSLTRQTVPLQDAPYQDLVHLRRTRGICGRYDVDLQGLDRLKPYDRVECHTVVYPYARTISSDDIHFNPFEEYVQDVLSRQRSAYSEILNSSDQVFGLLLGALIALIFALVDLKSLLEIEAILSVIGAYVVAKELWHDFERLLINATKDWRLRYQESDYRYQLEKRTTLTAYSYLAKQRRYGKQALLPEKIDFIKQSNSQTLRMCFDVRDLPSANAHLGHLYSIQIDESLADAFQNATESAFLFGVKLSFARRFLGLSRQFEVFQSLDAGRKGCLDAQGEWQDNAAFCRQTLSLGRLKFYARHGIIRDVTIIVT